MSIAIKLIYSHEATTGVAQLDHIDILLNIFVWFIVTCDHQVCVSDDMRRNMILGLILHSPQDMLESIQTEFCYYLSFVMLGLWVANYHGRSVCLLKHWKKEVSKAAIPTIMTENRSVSTRHRRQAFTPIQGTDHWIWILKCELPIKQILTSLDPKFKLSKIL